MGCCVVTVQAAIRSYGINAKEIGVQDHKGPRNRKSTDEQRKIAEDYLKTFNLTQTAKNFNVSIGKVNRAIVKILGKTAAQLKEEEKTNKK